MGCCPVCEGDEKFCKTLGCNAEEQKGQDYDPEEMIYGKPMTIEELKKHILGE